MSTALKREDEPRAPRPWDGYIPEDELAVYRTAGFGQEVGIGERPALLVIDVQYRSTGRTPAPLPDALTEYPSSCGEAAWHALPHIARLIALFRKLGFPVLYPYVAPKSQHSAGQFEAKIPGLMSIPEEGYAFHDAVKPMDGDILIPKIHASAFSGTPLVRHLIGMAIDTVVLTGCTTSGCVRCAAVDANSYNFRTIVAEDAVFDRSRHCHAINLFDIASKYADVMPTESLVPQLEGLSSARG
tara:strand:- start:367 stop:1095 length:729 start_codon:yes stop_codon:yes gene_type:complete